VHAMTDTQKWIPCDKPKLGDTLKWREPMWAEPSKPRGKRDIVGEQEITATLRVRTDFLELIVVDVQKISGDDAPLKVKINDVIKRKKTSLEKGECKKNINGGRGRA
jgi:hypothetical protein